MKPRCALLLVGLAGPGLALVAQAPAPEQSDSARLQGNWSMISSAADGFALPPDYVRSMKRVFAGTEVSVTMGQQLFFRATVVLDATRSPKTIDYHMTGGPTAGMVQLGIYLIVGDTVRFCFGAPHAARPTDFATAQGDSRTLSTWVRANP
jgi:uncharacterized protein (TIGR03067 family)